MIYGNYKSQVRPYTKHLAHNRYYGVEQHADKPPVTSYVVCVGTEIVFESKYRGECNRYILNNTGREYEIKAVRE